MIVVVEEHDMKKGDAGGEILNGSLWGDLGKNRLAGHCAPAL